ncbi:uncharacterized protein MEPE_01447 [Melanopsichium pennsylvanicum]|uniref:Nicotinamide-nucleotide adenylyltransferase n=1 Tax=Melanopsichium pennsylvanicum TaxID=63383 RepID=A0AAJ5C3K8_9BASI|nr:uncharacterized protein MEPE_01447 [Melanopsichium pennsylvanicum]
MVSTPSQDQSQSDMTLANNVARTASAATASGSGVRLVYSTNPSWPFPSCSSPITRNEPTIDIAVLDSSFNPPSRAHLGLVLSRPTLVPNKLSYDAHLLLFSTQNADKGSGKPGDASVSRRVHMMKLMAMEVERTQTSTGNAANVAVGLVDEPLIFAKSTLTWDLLKHQQQQQQQQQQQPNTNRLRLHWVVGFDTLYRVFQLKYYPSLDVFREQCRQFFQVEGTTFVCARRDPCSYSQLITLKEGQNAKDVAREEEERLLESDNVAPWVAKGCVGMLDIDDQQAKLSSTKIRELLKHQGMDDEVKEQRLKQLVPPSLVKYLIETKLYQVDSE